jgi:hypothetical protein
MLVVLALVLVGSIVKYGGMPTPRCEHVLESLPFVDAEDVRV